MDITKLFDSKQLETIQVARKKANEAIKTNVDLKTEKCRLFPVCTARYKFSKKCKHVYMYVNTHVYMLVDTCAKKGPVPNC